MPLPNSLVVQGDPVGEAMSRLCCLSIQQEDMFRASGGHRAVDDVFNEFSGHSHMFDIVQN